MAVWIGSGRCADSRRLDSAPAGCMYGIVNLKGKSIPEQARAMISIAHPDFRDDLDRDARAHGLIPRDRCIGRCPAVALSPRAGLPVETAAEEHTVMAQSNALLGTSGAIESARNGIDTGASARANHDLTARRRTFHA